MRGNERREAPALRARAGTGKIDGMEDRAKLVRLQVGAIKRLEKLRRLDPTPARRLKIARLAGFVEGLEKVLRENKAGEN